MEPCQDLDALMLEVKREFETSKPSIRFKDSVRLKLSSKRERVITMYEVINQETKEHHHYIIKIETYRCGRGGLWVAMPDQSLNLSDEKTSELADFCRFLEISRGDWLPKESGDFLVIPRVGNVDGQLLRRLLAVAGDGQRADMLMNLLGHIGGNPGVLDELVRRAKRSPDEIKNAATALNYARYSASLERLKSLVETSECEQDFQAHLEANPWMLGSEYSERLERRRLVRDSDFDHVMRKTTDDYLELIEIKTPMGGKPLFIEDRSHDCFFPAAPLSKVIGQVLHYLDSLEKSRTFIKASDGEDVNKIRAKIIIGRNSEDWPQHALRNLNGHLHRVEVVTYDQLLRTADRVLSMMRQAIEGDPPEPTHRHPGQETQGVQASRR